MKKISWKNWSPGLNNDNLTLGEVQHTLPGNKQEEIHFIIRLFENPVSPIAFKGAIPLKRHDLVHILLGRGLLPQDEAFVIGFTMGTSKNISKVESKLFEWITKYLYPTPYNFNDNHLKVFRLGIETGKKSKAEKIYDAPLEDYLEQPLGQIRERLGIDTAALKKAYHHEKLMLPETKESQRLP